MLYTTLDILLNFKHDDITMDINKNSIVENKDEDGDGKPDNKIFDEIGDALMSYIVSRKNFNLQISNVHKYDVFVWGDIGEENLTLYSIKKSTQTQMTSANVQPNDSILSDSNADLSCESDGGTVAQLSPIDLTETKPLRLRDMIAHGLVDPLSISRTFSEYCWTLALCLASKYDLRGEFSGVESGLNLGEFVQRFTPRFHPMTLLLNEVEMFHEEWKTFNTQFTPFTMGTGDIADAKNRSIGLNYPANSLKQPAGLPPSLDRQTQERDLIDIINRLTSRKDDSSAWFDWDTLIRSDPPEVHEYYHNIRARGSTQRKITLLGILRKITYHCHQMLLEVSCRVVICPISFILQIRIRFDYLKKIVDDRYAQYIEFVATTHLKFGRRIAWKRHRVNYSQLVELLPYLSLAIIMLICTVDVFMANDLRDFFVTVNSGRSESVAMLTWSCSGNG